jgi:hypothetical protein
MTKYLVALLLSVVLTVMPAMAAETFGAHVLTVNAGDTLNLVDFEVDAAVDGCAAGQYLRYAGGSNTDLATKQASVRSTYALLLAAKLSGQTIHIDGNGDAGPGFCTIRFVELR